jgi:hypothetical protein
MKDRDKIQYYINSFRNKFSNYLKPGVGVKCKVYPVRGEGAALEFYVGKNEINKDDYRGTYDTLNDVIKDIDQSAFGGNIDAFNFTGTNYVLEDNRIILIKGSDSKKLWNQNSAKRDIKKIVNKSKSKV